jgi:type II secretory pathway component PulF
VASFEYKAIKADGRTTNGSIEAGGRQDAFRKMESQGLRPIRLTERKTESPTSSQSASRSLLPWQSGKITFKMLENFTRLLSSLLSAGVPLSRALVILYREAATPSAGERWKAVHDFVVDGMSLAASMGRFPDTFPKVYVAMVEAGETGGFLDIVLGQIADFQSRDKELRGKVLSAMIYPVVLLFLALAVLVFLMVFFIPRFKVLFEGFDAALPLLTQVIVGCSAFCQTYGFFILIGVGIAGVVFRNWLATNNGRRRFEQVMLNLPVIGPLNAQFAMARFCRMLGTLLNAGVPLIQGLNVARRSIGNQILVDAVSDSIERVKKGDSLARSLSDCRVLFHGSILEMISVAEESGRLDDELIRLAATTEKELDQQLKMAVSLMEPLMLFLIAGFIGTIFIGMVIPIFTIQDYIK